MSKSEEKSHTLIPKETIHEIRKIVEEKLDGVQETALKIMKERETYVDDSSLMALGVAFVIGLAFGVALTKRKE